MAAILSQTVRVTTTGSAGSATGSATSTAMHGFLLDAYLNYHASAPATTDVTIAHVDPTMGNVLVVTDANTDARFVPRETVQTTAGATSDPDGYDRIALNGKITVSVAGADALTDCVVATLRWLAL